MKYGYGMQEAWAGEQGLDWMPFHVPPHLEIQDSARIGFNKSSTQTREAYRHLPYSMFSYFLKGKQRSTSCSLQKLTLLSGKEMPIMKLRRGMKGRREQHKEQMS